MNRRDFLRRVPRAAALGAAPSILRPLAVGGVAGLAGCRGAEPDAEPGTRPDAGPSMPPLEAIGVQLYTVRDLMAADVEGTLATLAEIGYREVEFAGLHGLTPLGMREILDRHGLRAASSHHPIEQIRGDWSAVLDEALTLGQGYVVCPWIDEADRTAEGLRRVADDFNRAGEAAREVGLRFGYHNHDFEFIPVDGQILFEILLERCDADLVCFELDLFWTVHGGSDPLALLADHPERFPLFHVKDRSADGTMVAVGEGVIDFAAIFAAAGPSLRHAFVEHDNPEDALASVRTSYQTLHALRG